MSGATLNPITVNRVAKAAGITKDQAALALAAVGEPPTGGPAYTRRMGYFREFLECIGESVWRMSDATLEKRLRRYPRCAVLIDLAKQADGPLGDQDGTPAERSV